MSTLFAQALLEELRENATFRAEVRDLLAETPASVRMLTPAEAADRLHIHVDTLRKAAAAGRVVGAVKQGVKLWRFNPDTLELLPPAGHHVPEPGLGHGRRRRGGPSSAVNAIRGTA